MAAAPVAQYFDGRTAGRHSVRLELGAAALKVLSHPDGAALAEWPYDSIRVVAPPSSGRGAQFACDRHEDALLSITDAGLAAIVAGRAQREAGPHRRRHRVRSMAAIAAGLAAVLALGYATWTPLLDLAARAIPESWERALGRSGIATLAPPDKQCRTAEGQAALDRLVARLSGGVASETRFEAQVSRNKLVNAFALPGGYIVLLSGLIDEAASGDEVAGVLAHEMAHVVEHHSARLIMRQYGLSLLASVLMGDSRMSGAVSTFGIMAYSREFEAQADARAIEILARSGIRNGGLASFFARLEKKHGNDAGMLRYLSSHPPSAERRDLAQRSPESGTAAMSEADWRSLRAICAAKS